MNAEQHRWIIAGCLLATLGFTGVLRSEDARTWPQFRGPNGLGHSPATHLPVHWSADSPNIRWKTTLPGDGDSSPIISGHRVFVTTAYETPQGTALLYWISILGASLITIACLGWLWSLFRARRRVRQGLPNTWPGDKKSWAVEIINSLLVFCFLGMAAGVTLFPRIFDHGLDYVGLAVAHVYPDLQKIVTIDPTVQAGIWLTGGAIALVGLATAALMLRGFIWRLMILGALVGGAWWLFQHTPLDQWYEKIEKAEKRLFLLPGLILSGWVLASSFKVHHVPSDSESPHRIAFLQPLYRYHLHLRTSRIWLPGDTGRSAAAFALLGLTALVFVPGNYLITGKGITRAVFGVDLKSGNILWQTPVLTGKGERKHSDNSYATPTCATDGRHVLAFFGSIVVCLDREGRVLWQHRDEGFIKNSKYGAASSPIIVDGRAVVLQGKEAGSRRPAWLAAYDIDTGQTRWCIHPKDLGEGYPTVLAHRTRDNRVQLFVHSQKHLNAYDLADGRRLWSIPSPIDQIVASLVLSKSTLVAGGGTYGPKAILALTLSDHPEQPPQVKWQAVKGTPGCSSPVIVNNRLYLLTDRGLLTCYDLSTGTVLWDQALKGRHLASLVTGAGKLYALSTQGRMTVLDAQAQDHAKILAQNMLPGKCFATPALSDDCLILRVGRQLVCIGAD